MSDTTLREAFGDIADAIRAKGVTGTMSPLEMPTKIAAIPSGGGGGTELAVPFHVDVMTKDGSVPVYDSQLVVSLERNGTVEWTTMPTLQTSWDGTTWTDWDYLNETKTLDFSEKGGHPRVYIKAKNATGMNFAYNAANYLNFKFASGYDNVGASVAGNIMSLKYGKDWDQKTSLPAFAFVCLFNPTSTENAWTNKLFSAKNLLLPAVELPVTGTNFSAYYSMFSIQEHLIECPERLPAFGDSLNAKWPYQNMFVTPSDHTFEKYPTVMNLVGALDWMWGFCGPLTYSAGGLYGGGKSITILSTDAGGNGATSSSNIQRAGGMFNAFFQAKIEECCMPNLVTVGNSCMYRAFFKSTLKKLDVPNLRVVNDYGMYDAFEKTKLSTVSFPKLVQVFNNGMNLAFDAATDIKRFIAPHLSKFGTNVPRVGGANLELVDLSKATAIPTRFVSSSSETYKVIVPKSLYNDWIATTGWSGVSTHIVGYDPNDGLAIRCEGDSATVSITQVGTPGEPLVMEVSTDWGQTWNTYTVGDSIALNGLGDVVMFRAGDDGNMSLGESSSDYYKFTISGDVSVEGDITKLLDNAGFSESDELMDYSFYGLFKNCAGLKSAPKLFSTVLGTYCYAQMFYGCTSLEYAPDLPATTLAEGCYDSMFYNCYKLKSIRIAYTGNFSTTYFNNWVYGIGGVNKGAFVYLGSDNTEDVYAIPAGWNVGPTGGELTFTAREANSTVSLNTYQSGTGTLQSGSAPAPSKFEYTTDGIWKPYTLGTTITLANIGDTVGFKAETSNGPMAESAMWRTAGW